MQHLQPNAGHPLRILIVDDHELVRDGICARLEGAHHLSVIGQATNGEQAVELAESLKPDLVMMDINMPVMNGLDAAAKIRSMNLPCAILVLSLYDNQEYVTRARTLGANGYALKDVSQQQMLDAIIAATHNFRLGNGQFHCAHSLETKATEEALGTEAPCQSTKPYNLTERELEILAAIAMGRLNKQIAGDLDISVRTVESHRSAIRQKTGGGNAAGLARIATELGL